MNEKKEGDALFRLWMFFQAHTKGLLWGAVVLALFVAGAVYHIRSRAWTEARATEELAKASAGSGYEVVMKSFPGTGAAAIARVRLALGLFEEEKFPEARKEAETFIGMNPAHPLAADMQNLVGYAYEEEGAYGSAIEAFERIRELYPSSYLNPQAEYSIARCLIQEGKTEEALARYRRIVKEFPMSLWVRKARERIERLEDEPSPALPEGSE